jgi:hypothetical protein
LPERQLRSDTFPESHRRAITAYANAVESNVETLHELAEAFDRGLIILKGVAGIGIAVEKAPDTEGLKITSVKPNMPAAAAGILEGDILVSLNGKAIRNKKLEESLASMRGSAGTAVSITLLRGDQQRQLILKRAPLAKVEPGRQKDMVNGTAGLHDLAVSLQQQLVSETKSLLAMRNDTPNLRITYNVAVRITNLQSILSDAHGRTSALVEQILSAKPSASQLFQRINKLLSKCREECGNLGSEAAALDQELEDLKLRNQISDIDEDLLNLGVSMLGTLDSLQIALKLNPRLFDEVSAR